MFEISRRDLVLGSTGAALVFGLKGPVSFIGAAHAQRAADSLKYKVGDIEVFSLHEGSIERVAHRGLRQERLARRRQEGADRRRHRPRQVRQPLYRHRDPDRRQGRAVRHRLRRQRPGDGRQARRQHEGGRPRSGDRLHGRDLAFPSRSHLRPVGEGDQRAGISECGNPDARGGVQVLDRSGAGGEAARKPPAHVSSGFRRPSRPGRTSSSTATAPTLRPA